MTIDVTVIVKDLLKVPFPALETETDILSEKEENSEPCRAFV